MANPPWMMQCATPGRTLLFHADLGGVWLISLLGLGAFLRHWPRVYPSSQFLLLLNLIINFTLPLCSNRTVNFGPNDCIGQNRKGGPKVFPRCFEHQKIGAEES